MPGRTRRGAPPAPWRVYNIGNHTPLTVNDPLTILADLSGRKAVRIGLPKPPGDVEATFADVESLSRDFGFRPSTPLRQGLARFVAWYRDWKMAVTP